jgi:hypothetical protein
VSCFSVYIYISGSAVFNKSGSESFMPTRNREGVPSRGCIGAPPDPHAHETKNREGLELAGHRPRRLPARPLDEHFHVGQRPPGRPPDFFFYRATIGTFK